MERMTKTQEDNYVEAINKTNSKEASVFCAPDGFLESVEVYLRDVFGQGPMTERERLLVRVGYTRNSRERKWGLVKRFCLQMGPALTSGAAVVLAGVTLLVTGSATQLGRSLIGGWEGASVALSLAIAFALGGFLFTAVGACLDGLVSGSIPMETATAGEIVLMDRLSRTPNGWGPGCDRPEGV